MEKTLEEVICGYGGGKEVTSMDAYTEIFRLGDHYIQAENEAPGQYKANPIAYWRNNDETKGHYRIMFEDTFADVLVELQQADFAILNGITYFGRRNVQAHASKMYAMIFDLDGVTPETLGNFFKGTHKVGDHAWYPLPNFIALSGHNVHLYYVFDKPISLFPYTKIQLKNLKFALTSRIWNMYTSTEKRVQHQGINQGFRVFGGQSKIPGRIVRVFKINQKLFSLAELSRVLPDEFQIEQPQLFKESKYTLDEAKKKFPKWYNEVVLQKLPRKTWQVKRALYDWWMRKIGKGIDPGHRYFCIMALAIFAAKCGIDGDELKQDAYGLVPIMDGFKRNAAEAFTVQDVDSALECFDPKYCTFPRHDLEKITSIDMPANKRNGRPQKLHLMGARAIQSINDQYNGTNWREGNGRPKGSGTKQEKIQRWRKEHPQGRKIDCSRDTGIDPKTIRKWWDRLMSEGE